jgi:hypothetical protein
MSASRAAQIVVYSDGSVDPSVPARWTEQLGAELRTTGLPSKRPGDAEVPDGAKSDAISLTQLVVSVASSGVLVAVVQTVQSFVTRARGSKIRIEFDGDSLELDNVDDEQRQQIINAWLARQVGETDPSAS